MTEHEPSFSIENFTILPSQNRVLSDNEQQAITPKMMAVLNLLASQQGETISKDDIMNSVWGDVVVSDMVLSRAISDLRKVFGDSASKQIVIETVSKKGYRLKLPVVWLEKSSPENKRDDNNIEKSSSKTLNIVALFMGFLVIISSVLILKYLLPFESKEILTLKKTNITTDDAIERRVRFSPDGKYIVYDSHNALVVRQLKDNKPTVISESFILENDKYLTGVFSPDGKQIAFRRLNKKDCGIHLYNFIESNVRYFADCSRASSNGMDWSENGKFIITTELDADKRIMYVVKIELATGNKTIVAEPTTSNTGYLFPRISPDNKSISVLHYRRFESQWGIGIINLEDGSYKDAFSTYEKINQIVWKNQNSLFYVIDGENGVDAGIWEIDLTNSQRRLVLNADIWDMDYNQKTRQFIYTQNQKHSSVWVANKEDDQYTAQPLITSAFQSTEPRLSPNEKQLAYISQRSGSGSLWIRDLISNKDTQIYTIQHAELTDISWSPDGAYLLITSFTQKGIEIHKLKIADRTSEMIKSSQSILKARWGKNNKEIYIYEKNNEQWQISTFDKENAHQPALIDTPLHHYQVSDDHQIFYQPLTSNKIFRKNILIDDKDELIAEKVSDWTLANEELFISRWNRRENTLNFTYYNFKEKNEILNGVLKVDAAESFSWQRPSLNINRDSQKIYFVKTKRTHSDIVLVSSD